MSKVNPTTTRRWREDALGWRCVLAQGVYNGDIDGFIAHETVSHKTWRAERADFYSSPAFTFYHFTRGTPVPRVPAARRWIMD